MDISNNSVEELRTILCEQYGREVSFLEAKQYGLWLLKFYTHLSGNPLKQDENKDPPTSA